VTVWCVLLQLRTLARQAPEQPAQQCWHTIARKGGYLGRKGDGPPGWKTLWLGWFYVQALLEGVHLTSLLSVDSSSDP